MPITRIFSDCFQQKAGGKKLLLVRDTTRLRRTCLPSQWKPISTVFEKRETSTKTSHEIELLDFIRSWANALDEIYLFGSLMEYVKIELIDLEREVDLEQLLDSLALGYWDHEKRTIFLSSYNHHGRNKKWDVQDPNCTINLISTLIHEMMHAFSSVFAYGDIDEISPCEGWGVGLGSDSHGSPWATAIATVQMSLNELFHFRVDDEILCSVQRSTDDYGRWATRSEMFRWGASDEDMRYREKDELKLNDLPYPH